MEKALYLNGVIKDEVYIGYGKLEFGKFTSPYERKLPNNLDAEKFRVLFAVHNGFQRRLKEDYINKNYNKFDSKYNNLLTDFTSNKVPFEKIFKETKTFICDIKETISKRHTLYSHQPYVDIYEYHQGYDIEGPVLFEFEALWKIEQLFFLQLLEAIHIYNKKDISSALEFFGSLKKENNRDGPYLETKIFTELKNNQSYKNAFNQSKILEKAFQSFVRSSFGNNNRKFLRKKDFRFYFDNTEELYDSESNKDNSFTEIKINNDNILDYLKDFIFQKINFLMNLSIKVKLSDDTKGNISENAVASGLRGLLTYQCVNLLKTSKGSTKCKREGCENYITLTAGSGRRDKIFCGDVCRNKHVYTLQKKEIDIIEEFYHYDYDIIKHQIRPFDAIILPKINSHEAVIIFCEVSRNLSSSKNEFRNAKLLSLMSRINEPLLQNNLEKIRPEFLKNNILIKVCFLNIEIDEKYSEKRNYTYFFKLPKKENSSVPYNEWGVFKQKKMLTNSDLLKLSNQKPESIAYVNTDY